MFFPSFVSVYQRAGRSLCHQRKSISKWPVPHNCAELFDASVKKTPFVGRPYPSEFISHCEAFAAGSMMTIDDIPAISRLLEDQER
jgi:hypothetical protein